MPQQKNVSSPELQGTLDKFCGIYAILNSVNYLIGNSLALPLKKREQLFRNSLGYLQKNGQLSNVIAHGMHVTTISNLAKFIVGELPIRNVPKIEFIRPFHRQKNVTIHALSGLFEDLNNSKNGLCAIVRILGAGRNHWTVIRSVDRRMMRLIDSDESADLSLDSLQIGNRAPSTGYAISQADVLILRSTPA